jgi:hypothetical protein
MDMQPIEPHSVMHFQLTAEQCEIVLRHLNTGQHGVVRPVIDSLVAQLQRQSQPASPMASYGQQGTLPPVQGMPQEADNA